MAAELDDGEFWLPPQFLTDDDILMDFKANNVNRKNREADTGVYFPNEFPFGCGSFGPYSDLGSPVESVVSSTETESDEEDYIAELTRKMAHSTLSGFGYESHKSWAVAGSPQSTLCGAMGSSRGSPNCPSQVSSPPSNRVDAAWDLLNAAAGEVARMRMIEEATTGYYQNRGLLGPVSAPLKNPNPNPSLGFHSNQSFSSYQQLQVAQFQQLKHQQMLKQQYQQNQSHQMVQNRARNSGRHLNLSHSAWPTLQQSQQQQQGSGMRAVFLGNTSSKRECAGTGVFLPRRVGSPTETRKKPGCSTTVLLPDRVVQALNLNLEAMDVQAQPQFQARYSGTFTPDYDSALKYRNNVVMPQQKQLNVRPHQVMNHEVRLPQEWTY